MDIQPINPPGVKAMPGLMNHAMKVGNTVYVSGQIARDQDGNTVGKNDFSAQAEQVYSNVQAVLAGAGATMQDVVKMNSYLIREQDLSANWEIRKRYFTGEPPAATLVFVSALADPDLLIEVEVIAVIT